MLGMGSGLYLGGGQTAGKRVNVEADTLTPHEWFFLVAVAGMKPGALPQHAQEFREVSLGLSRAEQMARIQLGLESLMARGFVDCVRDESGQSVRDRDGAPAYRIMGNVVTRVRQVDPSKFV